MSTWHAGETVAVFGARPKSLGAAIAALIEEESGNQAVDTYGPGRGSDGTSLHDYDFAWHYETTSFSRYLLETYDNVVVTIGINLTDEEDPLGRRQMDVNFHCVMALAEQWARLGKLGQFVAISSNSAHIARSPSIGYCASKAALSMGIRSIARREAGKGIYYAWEFGLLKGTQMTEATLARVPEGGAACRIPAFSDGLPVDLAAQHVYNALKHGWRELNGCTLRVDGGEQ